MVRYGRNNNNIGKMIGSMVEGYFDKRIIKASPFGDDKEYAKLCADELCEKLNERI